MSLPDQTRPPGPAGAAAEAGAPRSQVFVGVLALAGIAAALQQTVVVPLVPQLPRLLDAAPADTTWVVTATLLSGAVATPVVGRLADMVGKRRMLLACLSMLILGSVVSALSTSLVPLIVGRALQGLATGIIPIGISLMRDHLPPARLGSATALMSASLGVGGALGLPLSALVAQNFDFHVLFWAGGALGVIVTALVLMFVPESPQRAGGRFDLLGALGLSIALVSLLLAVSKGGTWGWASPTILGLLALAVVALLAWGAWELRSRQPLVDLRVSSGRQVLLTNAASAVFGFSMFAMSLVFPQLLQLPADTGYGLGQSIVVAGLVLAPGGLCMMAMSPVSARISAASGPRTTLMVGAVVVALGYGVGVMLHAEVWHLVICSVIISSGIGLAYGAMPSLVMAAVPVTQTASANSLNNLMRAIGTAIASSVAGVLLAQLTTSVNGRTVPAENAFVIVMAIGAISALVALLITWFIPARPTARPEQGAPSLDTTDQPTTELSSENLAVSAATRHSPVHETPVRPGRPVPDAGVRPRPGTVVLAVGTVSRGGRAAHGAVVTLISSTGRDLGHTTADDDGHYRLRGRPIGTPHLLIARWQGSVHAEFVGPETPVQRDVYLSPTAPRSNAARHDPNPYALGNTAPATPSTTAPTTSVNGRHH